MHMTFDISPKDDREVGFTLRYTRDGQAEERDFACVPTVPSGAIYDLPMMGATNDSVVAFLMAVIVEEQTEEFRALIHDKTVLIDAGDLVPVYLWLLREAYTDRPTVRPSPSGNGHGPTVNGSGASSDSVASSPTN